MVCSLLAYAPMDLFLDDASSSGLILSHVLYKAAFVIALMRWVLYWAFRLRQRLLYPASSVPSAFDLNHNLLEAEELDEFLTQPPPMASSCSSPQTQLIRDSLVQTTYEEIKFRRGSYRTTSDCDTCAVCLCQLEPEDEVRELRNCRHVFHTECIDRWLEYHLHHHHHHHHGHEHDDNHTTCPLCRTPLLTSSQIQSLSWDHRSQPSWAVERLLYLFGDDLVL